MYSAWYTRRIQSVGKGDPEPLLGAGETGSKMWKDQIWPTKIKTNKNQWRGSIQKRRLSTFRLKKRKFRKAG